MTFERVLLLAIAIVMMLAFSLMASIAQRLSWIEQVLSKPIPDDRQAEDRP